MAFRRPGAAWLLVPFVLLGIWGVAAPRLHPADHHRATATPLSSVRPAAGGLAGAR